LGARIAQAGDLDHCLGTQMQPGAGGQAQQVDAFVVMFSPIWPGDTSKPDPRSSLCSSAWIKWTCRRFGVLGLILTATDAGRSCQHGVAFDAEALEQGDRLLVTLVNVCLALRLTAATLALIL